MTKALPRYSRITGTGSYLPPDRVSNADLAARLAKDGIETSDEWIVERTGIRFRHFAAPDVAVSDLALIASRSALEAADCDPRDLDLIIVATSTPDMVFPSSASILQAKLGIAGCAAFDLQAVCSGFVYALATTDALIKAGQARRALVIGAETFSKILDWTDRTTCVLFGDGAGAVVLGAEPAGDRGILTSHLRSDGRFKDKLYVDGGPSSTGTVGHVRMEGREVFKHAVAMVGDVIEDAFAAVGIGAPEIDWFVPHQANVRIIDATAHRFHIPMERVVRTIGHHGNTSAASIPLALAEASGDGRIKRGDLVLLESMGGGFTWGSAIIRW